jgi:hypothetical protein
MKQAQAALLTARASPVLTALPITPALQPSRFFAQAVPLLTIAVPAAALMLQTHAILMEAALH